MEHDLTLHKFYVWPNTRVSKPLGAETGDSKRVRMSGIIRNRQHSAPIEKKKRGGSIAFEFKTLKQCKKYVHKAISVI